MARRFLINNVEVKATRTWSITDKIDSISTLQVTVVDKSTLESIIEGQNFQLFNDVEKIYEGIIWDINDYEEYPNFIQYDITVADNNAKADKRRIGKVYANEYAGDIVRDLILEKLSEEGITAGDIANGPIILKAVFNYIKVTDALNKLKELTGYSWNIDVNNRLNFFNRSTYLASFELNSVVQHVDFERNRTLDDYRNTEILRAGKGTTSTQNQEKPTPAPDGTSKQFIVRFPIAEKPTIEVNINGAGWAAINAADIGVNGLDTNKKYYFTYDSNVITQDSTETILRSDENGTRTADEIRITYNGLYPIRIVLDDAEQIFVRANIEVGTSGIYEHVEENTNINDVQQGRQYADGLLDTYGKIGNTVTFNTEVPGLKAGQLLKIVKPLYGINEYFLISSVGISPIDNDRIRYKVKCLSGANVGGWEEFFKKLIEGNKKLVISENEVVILTNTQTAINNTSGEYNIKTISVLRPSIGLYPNVGLTPGTKTGEVNKYD